MKKIVFLLTATLNPGDFDFVGRKGLENRLADYVRAIRFYSQLNFPIVFIDNSNFLSEEIKSILVSTMNSEYHTFSSIESVNGKGHGEMEIINYGYKHSELMKNADVVIKVSGRYIISNLQEIISGLDEHETIHYCNMTRNLFWADTRIMILTYYFYTSYLNPRCISSLDESHGIYFEKIYARSIHSWMADGKKINLLKYYPFYDAVNGQNNKVIKFNFYKRLKYLIYFRMKHWIFKQSV